jgi:HEAT repeat protein
MDSSAQNGVSENIGGQDPRLQPTPDYGSFGPSSDIHAGRPVQPQLGRLRVIAAISVGVFLAIAFLAHGTAQAAWEQLSEYLTLQGKPQPASPAIMSQHEIERLDRQPAQKQAELLLERAINHYEGANDQIAARVDHWRLGHLKLTPHLTSLITAALNSNDLRVRAAAIEIDLAAMNLAKVPSNVDLYAKDAESPDQSVRNWAFWALGLLGNRGVDTERVTQVLVSHLHDADPESRHWAVEALALVGTDETIAPLLRVFHDDASAMVRERAACSLAQSGMLNEQQRRSAIPELLNFADDPALDAQTHSWVFHALRDISGQNLPDEASAWRNWYSTVGS